MNLKLILFIILLGVHNLYPDTFLLKDGKKIIGTQLERTKKAIIYKDTKGVTKTIPIDKIKSVKIDNNKKVIVENYKILDKNDPPQNFSELLEKLQDLSNKVEDLTEKNKLQSQKIAELSDKKTSKQSKNDTLNGNSQVSNKEEKEEEDDNVGIDLTTEIVSDFIWRGNSYGGEYLSRRNNKKYDGTTQYWALQPNIRINSPIKGLYLEFWGNFALVDRKDTDSDLRMFQASPGSPGIDPNVYFGKLNSYYADPSSNPVDLLYDPSNNIVNSKCIADGAGGCTNPSDSFVDPRKIKPHKEKNGMERTDGGFTTFAYNFQNKKFGDITWGIWFYYQFDKNAKYSWDEYFIFWGLPFLQKSIAPTFAFYTQSSFDFDSIYAGGHYGSFTISHTFFEEKFFRIKPVSNIGYKYQNNNIDQKSGWYDWTNNLYLYFGKIFVSVNHVYRPDLHMYDSDTWYYPLSEGSQTQPNRSNYDGKTVDPSKLYGYKNEAVYAGIDNLDAPDVLKNYAKEQYQSQKIVRNLYYISFGYDLKF